MANNTTLRLEKIRTRWAGLELRTDADVPFLLQEIDKLLADWREQDQALQDIFGALGLDTQPSCPADVAKWAIEQLGVADAERSASDCDPVVSCPHCGCVNDASVSNCEDVIEHLTKGKIPVVVPVWTCHACEQSWTGHRAEAIRDAAVAAFPTPPTSGGTE